MNRPAIDPAATGEQLSALAAQHPELHTAIALHPNAYDGLLDWIASYGDDAAKAAVDYRRSLAAAPVAAAGPAAPVAPPPPRVLPEFAAAAAPADPVMVPAASVLATKPKRRLKAPVIAVVAVALVLALGGGAWAVVNQLTRGAATPQAAAEKLVAAALDADPIGLYTVLAPSEANEFRAAAEQLAGVKPDPQQSEASQKILADLAAATTITADDFEYETEEVASGVAIVRLVAGTIRIDGDSVRIADALVELARIGLQAQPGYYGDLEDQLEQVRQQYRDVLDDNLPWSFDVGDLLDEIQQNNGRPVPSPLAVVTVDEGGWYVSPILSFAELASYYSLHLDDRGLRRGDEIAEPARYSSPEEALEGTADAMRRFVERGDYRDLVKSLALPDRRLWSLYGGVLLDAQMRWQLERLEAGDFQLSVAPISADTTVDGDRARVAFDDLTFTYSGDYLTTDVVVRGTCLTVRSDADGYDTDGCLGDWFEEYTQAQAEDFGIGELRLILLREDGTWLVSPLATFGDAFAKFAGGVAKLADEGRLDDLQPRR